MAFNYLNSLIKRNMSNQSQIDKKISNYFLEYGKAIINSTITDLSDEIGVSTASIYTYVKRLGFNGFKDFKIDLASHAYSNNNSYDVTALNDISSETPPDEIASKIVEYNINLIKEFGMFLDKKKLIRTLKLMDNAKKLHFFGEGGSSVLAFDAYHKFIRTKYNCNYIFDYHLQLSYATKLGKDDLVLLFSHSGSTVEIIKIAKVLKKKGIHIISFTGSPNSELVDLSDIAYILYTEEVAFGLESLGARNLYSILIDILWASLTYHDEDKSKNVIKNIRAALSSSKPKS